METASAMSLPSLHDPHPLRAARQPRRDMARAAFEAALGIACGNRAALPSEVVDELADLARQRLCRAGSVVAQRGQLADSVWLLGSGSVALGALGQNGELEHVRVVRSEGWIDIASALLDGTCAEDIVCETDAVLWQVPASALRASWSRHPELLQALADSLALQVRQLTLEARELMTKDALARCAGWLLEHALPRQGAPGAVNGKGVDVAEVELRQRKRSIALQLGTTPETFSRVLSQLRSRRLIEVKGYHIALLDLPALRALAGA